MNFTGQSRTPPLRNPRQLAEVFSSRHSRALDETSRFRTTTWGRPYGIRGNWQKFFPLGTVAHRVKCHACGRPRGVAPTESAARRHMVFLLAFPGGKASHFRPVPPFSHRSKASVGDIRSPYGSTFQNSRHLVKGFSTRHSRALDETSRFEMWILQGSRSVRTRLILLTFPVGKSYATSAVLPLSHRSKASVGALVRFVGKRRRRRPRRRFSQENRANAPSADDGSSVTLAGDHAGSPLRMSISKCEFHRAE